MPKNIIIPETSDIFWIDEKGNNQTSKPPAGESHNLYQSGIHIGWGKNHVEVGVIDFEISTQNIFDSVIIPMDRKAINDFIHALRRARDAAFGKDA